MNTEIANSLRQLADRIEACPVELRSVCCMPNIKEITPASFRAAVEYFGLTVDIDPVSPFVTAAGDCEGVRVTMCESSERVLKRKPVTKTEYVYEP